MVTNSTKRYRSTAALLAIALLLWPALAFAHIALASSSPAKDAAVEGPLNELRLRFTGRVEAAYTSVRLLAPDGSVVALLPLNVVADSDNREFVTRPEATLLPSGRYMVEWRTAGADGHVITGSFGFTVSTPDSATFDTAIVPVPAGSGISTEQQPADLDETSETDSLGVAIRWANFTSLIALIGVVMFRLVVLPRGVEADPSGQLAATAAARAWRFAALATLLAAGALVARLSAQSAALHGADAAWDAERLRMMLGMTGWGRAWLLQLAGTVAVLVGLLITLRRKGRLAGWYVMAAAAVALAIVPALSGHAAAEQRFGPVAIIADTVHVLAAGAWIGTLAALLLCGIPATLALPSENRMRTAAALVSGFSRIAIVAVGALVVTGVIATLTHITAPADFVETSYGRVLALKLALLIFVLGTGFYNWRVVRPGLHDAENAVRLQRTAGVEMIVGLIVILVTAVLVALPTP